MTTMDRQFRNARMPKGERLEARVTRPLKELIQQAADLAGLSLTDFIAVSAQKAAEETIRNYSVISLSARDSKLFVEAVLNSNKPNENLQAAFARQDEDVESVD